MQPAAATKHPVTLAIDIGGSGVKCMLLDRHGQKASGRKRVQTPQPATPLRVLAAIQTLVGRRGSFDRVAVGFPGWVQDGVVRTAYNLHPNWVGFDLQKKLAELMDHPVRVINDAEVQGLGHMAGHGLEMMITLGTGVGSAVFVDGKVVPGLEVGQMLGAKRKTYDDLLNKKALQRVGVKRWRRRVLRMVLEIEPVWNYTRLYLGGGNARHLTAKDFPENVSVVSYDGGLWGGHVLWQNPDALEWTP